MSENKEREEYKDIEKDIENLADKISFYLTIETIGSELYFSIAIGD